MEMSNLQDLLVDNLKDLYSAEQQLLKALPKVAKKVENEQLRSAIELHLKETQEQARRLEQIFQKFGEKPTGKKCKGMEGLIEENKELMSEDADPDVMDAGLIVGSQKIEHYEIAGYGSAVTFAKLLGDEESARLLAQTLDEEERTDKKLTEIAESSINLEAAEGAGGMEEEGEMRTRSSGRSRSSGGRGKSSSRRR
ncbi:MAG: ferritin-like domain-containing protein [Planctomycetes bacterium]|nr:ferritin-like domain-containing protein [Planctomycetota bacterium]